MKNPIVKSLSILLLLVNTALASDPLPSWNDTAPKKAIAAFVDQATREGSPNFVPRSERIAVFDNDGTLWSEQPMYFQWAFTMDRIKAMARGRPEWKEKQPFKAVLEDDLATLNAGGDQTWGMLDAVTRMGATTEEFARIVKDWSISAQHPKTGRLYTEMVYQPMLELLDYLRAGSFKIYIVSGGWVDFMRPWTEKIYGIPPEQVIGSSFKAKFELREGKPVLLPLPEVGFINDGPGKAVAIDQHIGRRPIAAFGNSDSDMQMLQWTTAGSGARFALLVHHTDGEREWAYDRASAFGRLDKALDEAQSKGWLVVDMKNDWKIIHAFEKK